MDKTASEEVTLQVIKSKCLPVLLYGLEVCPLTVSDLRALDFVINRFLHEITFYECNGYGKNLPGLF